MGILGSLAKVFFSPWPLPLAKEGQIKCQTQQDPECITGKESMTHKEIFSPIKLRNFVAKQK